MTVDGSIQGQFETIVSWGSVTDSVQMEANIGMLKVGVDITDPANPAVKNKYVAI